MVTLLTRKKAVYPLKIGIKCGKISRKALFYLFDKYCGKESPFIKGNLASIGLPDTLLSRMADTDCRRVL
ncbi:hypothetical protein B9T50_03590 [Zymomonas mobilis subsp. mobilis]|nr:hypothetical protein B9T50_03590 [Zymomonas mobilis subsp. mobilis]